MKHPLHKLLSVVIITSTLFITGCLNSPSPGECNRSIDLSYADQNKLDSQLSAIDDYLTEHEISAQTHQESGLRYVINEAGTGTAPTICDKIAVKYTGKLMENNDVFDRSDKPISFILGNLIPGWQVGIPLVKPGGSITLYIPGEYAYGSRGAGDDIPADANLIFEIELVAAQ
ncbi:MAG: hypothetical protein FH748_02480 [Balneolaceae bacterium]|nr:hypothetical protein [Balneolaceae bacterium]